MARKDSIESKEKILKAAEEIFAEVGFDGARVDAIAKRAGVNKALIYYYFDSKDAILDALFETLMADGSRVQVQSLVEFPDLSREELYRQFLEKSLDFALSRRNLIKIALMESMKANSKHGNLLKRCDGIIDTEIMHMKKAYESKGMAYPYTKRGLVVNEFFTGIMPIFNYAVYFDAFMDYYGMSESELKAYFLEAFKVTHLAGHLNRAGE